MALRYILFWFVLMLVAVGNGILREATYGKSVGELTAHQISTVSGMAFTGVVVYFVSRAWPLRSSTQAWLIGISWLVLTVSFEFIFGHYVTGHTWERLLLDYNLLAGRVWLAFLIWVFTMPYVFYKFNEKRNH